MCNKKRLNNKTFEESQFHYNKDFFKVPLILRFKNKWKSVQLQK